MVLVATYSGNFVPRGCAIGRKPVYLTVNYLPPAVVQLSPDVTA